eukprot:1999186-Prymnesium_polylepis.1
MFGHPEGCLGGSAFGSYKISAKTFRASPRAGAHPEQGWVSVPERSVPFRSGWAGAADASFPSHTKRSSNTNG